MLTKTYMKNIIISTILFLCCAMPQIQAQAQQPLDSIKHTNKLHSVTTIEGLLTAAEQNFRDGQFPMAVANYLSVIEKGEHNSDIYYNLGCAYFQQNQIGKAVLNFARAKALNPKDQDVQYNLELALAKTKDKIEPADKFIIARWLDNIASTQNSTGWATTALVMLMLAAAAVLLWLISERLSLRKIGFFTAVAAITIFLLALVSGNSAIQRENSSSQAVIINNAVSVKSSPATGGKDIFILHEGTQLEIIQTLDNWSEIRLQDGNRGWMQTAALEKLWN